MIEVHQVIGGD